MDLPKFGTHYYGAFRIDLHAALLAEALGQDGEGSPCTLKTRHRLVDLHVATEICKFENGATAQADVVVGADGINVRLPSVNSPIKH